MLQPAGGLQSVCGTAADRDVRALRPYAATPRAEGDVIAFDQDPPLVSPGYSGKVVFRNFSIVGDVAALEFRRADRPDPPEVWRRLTTRAAGGRIVSIFEPAWDAADLDAIVARGVIGFEGPDLYWGSLVRPDQTVVPVYIRMGLTGIPASPVVRIGSRVQYASDVVNLMVPGFGDGRIAGGPRAFELAAVSNLFYQYFADRYDVLAIIPQSTPVTDYAGFHHNVQNRVSGLNLPLLDDTAEYGSAGVLQGIEVYSAADAAHYAETNHEMAHQWGSAFDWSAIAGVARAGHEPSMHAPLWTGGETLLGGVLAGTRRVVAGNGGYSIARTPSPVRFHPLDLYAMGALREAEVPDFGVFTDQSQIATMTPAVGTLIGGAIQRVRIGDVVRRHGPREGPAARNWRRATILVSRDRLASQAEMDFWNFFAQRLSDRSGRGLPASDGQVPFHVATNEAVTLSTSIVPRTGAALAQTLDTDAPAFGPLDWRGVEFTAPVPGRIASGTAVDLQGRVTATDPVDFDRISITFWRDGEEPLVFAGAVNRVGDFTVPVRFPAGATGRFVMSVYLFWPESGPQYPRASMTSILVD
jgi:hypothetical protein